MPNCPRDAALSNTWKTLRPQCNKEQNENEKRRRKKKNGRVKNRNGVQKEEGGKTFVYDKLNRAITRAFSRDLHLTLCS